MRKTLATAALTTAPVSAPFSAGVASAAPAFGYPGDICAVSPASSCGPGATIGLILDVLRTGSAGLFG